MQRAVELDQQRDWRFDLVAESSVDRMIVDPSLECMTVTDSCMRLHFVIPDRPVLVHIVVVVVVAVVGLGRIAVEVVSVPARQVDRLDTLVEVVDPVQITLAIFPRSM